MSSLPSPKNQQPFPLGLLLLAAVVALFLCLPAAAQHETRLAMAQTFLDQGNTVEALKILDRVLAKGRPNAEALLLRGTGRVMEGNLAAGYRDFERALEADPKLRQAWLNLAGLQIAEGRFKEAYDNLLEAQKLDPEAADNDLNLGAVLIMQGRLEVAKTHFDRYLEAHSASAEAHYLVASNYALADHEEPAVDHLRRAFELDEHYRLRARSDERFLRFESVDYKVLLNTDSYTPPAGAHTVAAAFRVPYRKNDNKLLYAVLDALKELGERYEATIESNPRWALVWGDMRIKVSNQTNGTGTVSLSAPAERFTDDEWHRRSQALFRAIHNRVGG